MRSWRRTTDANDRARYYREGWWHERTHLDDLLACIASQPDKAAIVAYTAGRERPQTLTFGQLGHFVDRAASALVELGIERGDVVSIQLANGWEFPVLALATLRAGAIPNPVPTIYREHELSFMLRHAGSKLLVVPTELRGFSHAALALKLKAHIDTLAHVVTVGEATEGALDFESHFLGQPWELAPGRRDELARRRTDSDDLGLLLYTSGTTGMPKASMHTHNTVWSGGQPAAEALDLVRDDVCFMASTMGHLTGYNWGMLLPLSMGQKVVYQDSWDAKRLLEMIEVERITWTISATPFALDLAEAREGSSRDISSFRAFVCGGAPIPPQVVTRVQEQLGVNLVSLWGCSEVGICTIHQLGAPIDVLSNSDGLPVSRMDLRIVDEQLKPVEMYEPGRLQVRGPGVCVGYYRQPELTAEVETPDGWIDTGDLGRATRDGGIRIVGRSKDIIIRGGQNIPVVEIENELARHPNVREVVVVGYPDDRLGERGCAVVVPRGPAPTLEDLTQQLESIGLTRQYWPERLEIVEALPRTPAGKVQKYVLRERLAAGKPL